MSEIKPITRWEPVAEYVSGDYLGRMVPDDEGVYVDYEDHESALAQARAEAVGRMYDECCAALDRGEDPRQMEALCERAIRALDERTER